LRLTARRISLSSHSDIYSNRACASSATVWNGRAGDQFVRSRMTTIHELLAYLLPLEMASTENAFAEVHANQSK
jgi:hypothetical protein